ncbi:MAG TPA: cupredoxin domain-containing protein [Anaerolineales bacterium]|nr:cupredoxin domain-containing protein [Anaerolineales bacterium]
MKKLTIPSLVIVLSLLLSSCSMHLGLSGLLGKGSDSSTKTVKATHTPPSNVTAISINNGKYRPKNVAVKVGTTLTWTNNDDTPQSVTSDTPGVFDSGALAPGATWQYTFSKEGTFPYHSTGTAEAYGTVTVTP